MADEPVKENDYYTFNSDKFEHEQKTKGIGEGNFRFGSFKYEDERLNKIQERLNFLDSAPKEHEFDAFNQSLRKRNKTKEVGPEWRYRPTNSIERVFDTLKNRELGHFNSADIANNMATQRMSGRRATSTLQQSTRINSPEHRLIPAKNLLPTIHQKTHFKATTSVFLKHKGSLNLEDGVI